MSLHVCNLTSKILSPFEITSKTLPDFSIGSIFYSPWMTASTTIGISFWFLFLLHHSTLYKILSFAVRWKWKIKPCCFVCPTSLENGFWFSLSWWSGTSAMTWPLPGQGRGLGRKGSFCCENKSFIPLWTTNPGNLAPKGWLILSTPLRQWSSVLPALPLKCLGQALPLAVALCPETLEFGQQLLCSSKPPEFNRNENFS